MTESSWLICSNPEVMLDSLAGKASDRKLRLFACACCRRIWSLLTDERSQRAVETAEKYADDAASDRELKAAASDAQAAADELTTASIDAGTGPDSPAVSAAFAAVNTTDPDFDADVEEGSSPFYAATNALQAVADLSPAKAPAEKSAQCHLLREIVGNPFRPVAVKASWLTPDVVDLAQEIYDQRTFDRLPGLADVLEKAGCDNAEILKHCREPGPHVRGCWALDAVLGKE